MRTILITSALMLSFAGAAFAATAPAPKAAPPAVASTPAATSKSSDCAKQWKAEKKHTETRKAFMAACGKA